ncbi:MAG: pyridoxal phosphate-dependent aminotransferase [Oscillospiraceae bacterium]
MVSQKMKQIGEKKSCIRELFDYGLRKAKEIGSENVFDFSLGNPSTPAPSDVADAISYLIENEDSLKINGYTSAPGDLEVRKTVVNSLNRRFAKEYTPDELFICSGAAPALIACIRALIVDEKSEIVALAPHFPEYKVFVEANGGVLKLVPAAVPSFGINFKGLESAIGANTQAVIVNSPNNPTGVVYSKADMDKLGGLLTEKSQEFNHPIYLISDEPYRELVFDGVDVPWVPDCYKNTIVCYSYSKSLSLPGQRIGWILAPLDMTDRSNLWFAITGAARISGHVCASSLYQQVIARCVDTKPDLTTYLTNRDLLYSSLTKLKYNCVYPQGAFYLFIEAPGGDAAAFSNKAKELGLLLSPSEDFGCEGWMRVSYCVPTERITRALPIFEKLIK